MHGLQLNNVPRVTTNVHYPGPMQENERAVTSNRLSLNKRGPFGKGKAPRSQILPCHNRDPRHADVNLPSPPRETQSAQALIVDPWNPDPGQPRRVRLADPPEEQAPEVPRLPDPWQPDEYTMFTNNMAKRNREDRKSIEGDDRIPDHDEMLDKEHSHPDRSSPFIGTNLH